MKNNNNNDLFSLDLSSSSSDDSSASFEIKKYFNLIVRRKYWLLLICLFTTIIWIVLFSLFQDRFIKYTTTALIRFDDPYYSRSISAVTDFTAGMGTASKVTILSTKSFLGRVVDSLNLNLIVKTKNVNNDKLFKKIEISSTAEFGEYSLAKSQSGDKYIFSYLDPDNENEVFLGSQNSQDSIGIFQGNEIYLEVNMAVLKIYGRVNFVFIDKLAAIGVLKDKMTYSLDRTQTILSITYSDKNPMQSALVTNTIAKLFIIQLLDYKKGQTSSIIHLVDEQLRKAQDELKISETALKKFKEYNPQVYLEDDRSEIIDDLAENEANIVNSEYVLQEINTLLEKKQNAFSADSKSLIYLEILAYLRGLDVPGISVFEEKYRNVLSENESLLNNYPPSHPLVSKHNQKIENLQNEIDSRVLQFLDQLKKNISSNEKTVITYQKNLKNLPSQELKLAELERNHKIKENIVSNIMVRYNEAKVVDAAIIPDAYIIDEAVSPIVVGGGIGQKIKMYSIGIPLGLFLGVMIISIIGFFDHRIWTKKEIEKKLSLPILATIPKIQESNSENGVKNKYLFDPKLLSADYAPTAVSEGFRRLRTVLNLDNAKNTNAVIIGSLNPGDGKSLMSANLAITYAQQRQKTLLIDCDIRKGVMHSSFGLKKEPGITNILMQDLPLNDKYLSQFIQQTHIPNLFLIASGDAVPNPSELLSSNRMKSVYEYLLQKFQKIVFDTPPFGLISDMFIINMFVHNMIIILKTEKTNLSHMKHNLDEFSRAKKDINGVIINDSTSVLKEQNYYKYTYYNY